MCVCAHCRGHNADDVMMPPLQEQCCRQGDDSLLQKALDESRRESQSGTQEVSLKTCECVHCTVHVWVHASVMSVHLHGEVGGCISRWFLADI